MNGLRKLSRIKAAGLLTLSLITAILWPSGALLAQGSIFGLVTNSNGSTPSVGEILFVGYLDDTDEEIRVEFCDGAGYGAGNWYDDFQNYLTESPGNPCDYIFHNISNGEGFHLSLAIPNNSFQQEDVQLGAVTGPDAVTDFQVQRTGDAEATLRWTPVAGLRYHLYRREASSNGSFFRIDNPSGDLSDPGIDDSLYLDQGLTVGLEYDYLAIAENSIGQWGPHAELITVAGSTSCCKIKGDINSSGAVDISDLTFLVSYMFEAGASPECEKEADLDLNGQIDISDLTYMIEYMFGGGPAPPAC
ncbi:MAG: dockerin type I domain-containing protein [bacterium]|nr:dockerin type I domain-containing protein [bacterium]